MATLRLALPYYTEGQRTPEQTFGSAWNVLDWVGAPSVVAWKLDTPPGSPTEHSWYLIGASPTGAWSGYANQLARRENGAWLFLPPAAGMRVYRVEATAKNLQGVWCYDATDGWFPTWRMWSIAEHWTGQYVGLAGDIDSTPAKLWRKCIDIPAFPNPPGTPVVTVDYEDSLVIDRNYPHFYELMAVDPAAYTLPTPAPLTGLSLDIVFFSVNCQLVALAPMGSFVGTLLIEYVKDI